jgi:hypothetical protein
VDNAMSVKSAMPLEEVVLAQAFEFEAILNLLERKGLISKAEIVEEIRQLKQKVGEPASPSPER